VDDLRKELGLRIGISLGTASLGEAGLKFFGMGMGSMFLLGNTDPLTTVGVLSGGLKGRLNGKSKPVVFLFLEDKIGETSGRDSSIIYFIKINWGFMNLLFLSPC
jgi:hypothetical protein